MKIRNKLIISFLSIALCISIVGIVALYYQERIITSFAAEDIKNAKDIVFSKLENNRMRLDGMLGIISKDNKIKELFMQKDRDALYSYCYPVFLDIKNKMWISHLYFIEPDGRCFLRVHEKELYGDLIERHSFITARDTNKISSGIELGKTAFALRAVMPYYSGKELIGYIEFAVELENVLKASKSSKYEFDLFAEKKYLDKNDWKSFRKTRGLNDNWDDFNEHLEISSTMGAKDTKTSFFNEKHIEEIEKKGLYSKREKIDGKMFSFGGFELLDIKSRHVGAILTIVDITNETNIVKKSTNILFYIIVFFTFMALLLSIMLSRIFTLPILKLTEAIKKFSKGADNLKIDIKTDDEIGSLAGSFNRMVEDLKLHKQKENTLLQNEIKRSKELEKAYNEVKQKENELKIINFELTAINKEYIEATKELKNIRMGLENEIKERTRELEHTMNSLETQVEKRTKELKDSEEHLRESLVKVRKVLESIINVISETVEKKDPYTAGHQRRVSRLARAIAEELGIEKEKIEGIRLAGIVHDLGKIAIPSEILSKPGKIDKTEFELIKRHAEIGYDILKDIDFPWPIAQITYQHHERMNGTGYPLGLKGDKIILESRIIAVADVVEAISSHRPYRPAFGTDIALKEITDNKGILYDSEVVDACVKVFLVNKFDFTS